MLGRENSNTLNIMGSIMIQAFRYAITLWYQVT